MRVRDLFAVLDRRKWIVLAVTVVTIAAVGVLTRLMTPTYSASSLVRIARVIDPSGDFSSITYADRVMTTYVELLQGRSYMAQVVERLGLDASPDALSDVVQVESLPNTELLRISVEHPRPEVARDVANTLAVLLREEGDRRRYQRDGEERPRADRRRRRQRPLCPPPRKEITDDRTQPARCPRVDRPHDAPFSLSPLR